MNKLLKKVLIEDCIDSIRRHELKIKNTSGKEQKLIGELLDAQKLRLKMLRVIKESSLH